MNISHITVVSVALMFGAVADATAQRTKTTCGPDVALNVTVSGTQTAPAFVRRHAGIALDGDERLSFQVSPIDQPLKSCAADPTNPNCATSFIRVYHPDATTWVLRPEPLATASHRVWAGGSYVFVGYETAPLEIVVTRQ